MLPLGGGIQAPLVGNKWVLAEQVLQSSYPNLLDSAQPRQLLLLAVSQQGQEMECGHQRQKHVELGVKLNYLVF